jgi:hypothetical protein
VTVQPFETDDVYPDATGSAVEQLAQDYAEAKADQAELESLRPVLALAISKLPRQTLKVSLSDRAKFGELALQMKVESKSGAILFRAVKAVD